MKSRVEAFRQQMFDFSDVQLETAKSTGIVVALQQLAGCKFPKLRNNAYCLENNKSLNSYAQIEQACFVPDYFKKHYGGV